MLRTSPAPRHALRLLTSLVGGYAFARGFVALGTAALAFSGVPYDDAWLLAAMLVFPLLVAVVIWAFASRRPVRVAAALGGGAVAMTVAALLLARHASGSA